MKKGLVIGKSTVGSGAWLMRRHCFFAGMQKINLYNKISGNKCYLKCLISLLSMLIQKKFKHRILQSYIYTFVVFVIIHSNSFSQEFIMSKIIPCPFSSKKIDAAFSVIDTNGHEFGFFMQKKEQINAFLCDSSLEIKADLAYNPEKTGCKVFLNGYCSDKTYYLLFSNKYRNKFYVESVSLNTRNHNGSPLDLKLKEERYLETICYNGKLYLITIKKVSSFIKIYTIDKNRITDVHVLDLSGYEFSADLFSSLYDEFLTESWSEMRLMLDIRKLESNLPYPIEMVSDYNKIYLQNDNIVITLDNNIENTILIRINLHDFSFSVKSYMQGNISSFVSALVSSNSFLYEDILFQTIVDKNELYLSARNLKNDSIVCSFKMNRKDISGFNNSPLWRTYGDGSNNNNSLLWKTFGWDFLNFSSKKEIKKTARFLRLVSFGNAGVAVFRQNDDLAVTLGGGKIAISIGVSRMPLDAWEFYMSGKCPMSSDYIIEQYNYYFKTLLSTTNFTHVDGDVQPDINDLIWQENASLDFAPSMPIVSKFGEYYLYGYYLKKAKKYVLRMYPNK